MYLCKPMENKLNLLYLHLSNVFTIQVKTFLQQHVRRISTDSTEFKLHNLYGYTLWGAPEGDAYLSLDENVNNLEADTA